MPAVTIGMPTYQNARTIERALRSLLAQTFADFRLLVSDDGSRDATCDIVREFAVGDARIELVQQPRNLNYGNFRFVLQAAHSEFFLFAAGDDWWEPRFLEVTVRALRASPDAVCASGRVLMHPDDAPPYLSRATEALLGNAEENLVRYLESPGDNSRMYGLYRTEAAQRSFPPTDHHAFDWTFCAATLAFGRYLEIDDTLMHREVTPASRYVEYVRRDNRRTVDRLMPLLPMSRQLLVTPGIPRTRRVLRALANLNIALHRQYLARYHPRVAAAYAWIARTRRITDGTARPLADR